MNSIIFIRTRFNTAWRGGSHQLVLAIYVLLFLQAACAREPSPYDELVKHGFYAYTVNEDNLTERGWSLVTPIKEGEWDLHCHGGISAPDIPLIVGYQDETGERQLTIWISRRGSMWDRNIPTQDLSLNTPWSRDGFGEVYSEQPNSPLRFEDIFGNKIVVWGDQPVTEKVELVNQFEYVGPPAEDVINPWSAEWCAAN